MNRPFHFLPLVFFLACAGIKERLQIKECKFNLVSVRGYDYGFSDLNLDFEIKVENPNKIDAVLDKLSYTFLVNGTDVFSGTTGKGIKIPAEKSKNFVTTINLEYKKIGSAVIDAITTGKAEYEVKARAYIETIIGEISYPVNIRLK
jgi:LEA14-like dessication related protein